MSSSRLAWALVLVAALTLPGALGSLVPADAAEGARVEAPPATPALEAAPATAAPPATPPTGDPCGGVAGQPNANAGCLLPLGRGINIDVWLRYGLPNEDVQPWDLERIRALGFTYVRLAVTPEPYEENGRLDEAAMAELDAKLDQVLAADLAAIVDLHPDDAYADPILRGGARQDEYVTFLEAFARALSHREPSQVALEMMNEPHDPDPEDGVEYSHAPAQRRFWEAARRAAPEMTLVATGADWSSIDGLETVELLPDENVIYDVHVYHPFLFTHQGATWTWDVVEGLHGVPYGSSPEGVEPLLGDLPGEVAQHLAWYGKERWGREKLAVSLDRIAAWEERTGARAWIGEFGAFKPAAPAEDRVRWTRDMRELADERGLPWAMWEWDRRFGLYDRATGEVDPALAEALGVGAST